MSMTPSRRTVESITLGDLAADNRIMVVRCNFCRRTRNFLASDLAEVYGAQAKMHSLFHQCSRCQRSDFLYVGTRLPNADDEGRLKVRRPKSRLVWSWAEVTYHDPRKRPQKPHEFVARSREGSGMGHNHDEAYTVEQSTIFSLLHNRGFWPPTGTREEKLAWLEENRWRVKPAEET